MAQAKQEVALKSGRKIPVGAPLARWVENGAEFLVDGQLLKVGYRTAAKALGKKAPSVATLEKWSDDGVCKSILGRRVEPDGHDSDGAPSWLLALGFI